MHQNGAKDGSPRRSLGGLELRCPPLPQTLVEALNLIDRPEKIEIGPVTEMIQRDPIVVARLLHTVNSAYYGLRQKIGSADRAVVMLGPVAVAGIVLGMHMLKLRSILDGPAGACFDRLIRHSIATAFLARHLLEGAPRDPRRKTGSSRVGAAFTAGLLHDFGKIILVYNFHEDAAELYDKHDLDAQISSPDDRELERLLFGCDHTEAGEFAARKLSFPDVLIDVIRHHHEPFESTGCYEADRLIHAAAAANLASKTMGYAFSRPEDVDTIGLQPVWDRLIESDHPRHATPDEMVLDLLNQQDDLDQYVEHLTSGAMRATDLNRLQARATSRRRRG